MPSLSRKTWLETYALKIEREWIYNDRAAHWAPSTSGGPQSWNSETRAIELVQTDQKTARHSDNATFAISPDDEFLAISTNAVIHIYEVKTLKPVAELVGHPDVIGKLVFMPESAEKPVDAKYMILAESIHWGKGYHNLIMWYLDQDGKSLSRTMPFAVEHLADCAIAAVSPDLTSHHELPSDALAEIRKSFAEALRTADAQNRCRNLPGFKGNLPSFQPFDLVSGQRFLHLANNETTQSGMRPELELPYISIHSFANPNQELVALRGHTDGIMWASFSPTDPNLIASASWDGTYRIWNVKTGECRHTIGPTGHQNWTGAFSPDGNLIMFSGGKDVAIYSVDTAEKLVTLNPEKLNNWTRSFAWSPDGDAIAVATGLTITLWEPFAEEGPKETEIFALAVPENRLKRAFMSLGKVQWLGASGDKLVIGTGDESFAVWDRKKNLKWRFQRPEKQALPLSAGAYAYAETTDSLFTLDGDWRLREWKLS